MSWIVFVLAGQFLNALVVLLDRYIVTSKKVATPLLYTFYVCLLSIVVIVMLPLDLVSIPRTMTIVLSLLSAATYITSIYFLYRSLSRSNALEVVPVVGGVSALSTFVFSFIILDQGLPSNFIIAFFVLTAGMLLISHFKFTLDSFLSLTVSGAMFGLSTTLIKLIFINDTFANGFFWSRMANVLGALVLIAVPGLTRTLVEDTKPGKTKGKLFVLVSKTLAGLAFLCILYAINNGDVTLVNALAATQYIYLFIFALIFSSLLPDYFNERLHRHEIFHKALATIMIAAGFVILFWR